MISAATALCMGVLCIPLSSEAPMPVSPAASVTAATEGITGSGTCGANLTWSIDEKERPLIIGGIGRMTEWDEIGKIPWRNLYGYYDNVIVEKGVTSISHNAFQGAKLHTVTLPDGCPMQSLTVSNAAC